MPKKIIISVNLIFFVFYLHALSSPQQTVYMIESILVNIIKYSK